MSGSDSTTKSKKAGTSKQQKGSYIQEVIKRNKLPLSETELKAKVDAVSNVTGWTDEVDIVRVLEDLNFNVDATITEILDGTYLLHYFTTFL